MQFNRKIIAVLKTIRSERTKIMSKQFISELKEGQNIDTVFAVRSNIIKQKKNGEAYLSVELADKTGSLTANMWDGFESLEIEKGNFVKVVGVVSSFAGKLQGTIRELKKIAVEEVEVSDFLPSTNRNIEEMFALVERAIDSLDDSFIKELVKLIFSDEEFVKKYKKAPAARSMHNAYLGGLLEHVVELLDLAEFVCKKYQKINRNLLVAGIILHDAAKVEEFSYETLIDYTDQGMLVGHITMGLQLIDRTIRQIKGFPNETKMQLEHIILSHHGLAEWGSPKSPMTLEAVALHYLDNLEAKISGFLQFAEKNMLEGSSWTAKAFMFDNNQLYVPRQGLSQEQKDTLF